MEILRTVILIGETRNEYIEDILSMNMNIFNLRIIPEKYIPSIKGNIDLERIKTDGELLRSGFYDGVAFYLLLQILMSLCVYNVIVSVIGTCANLITSQFSKQIKIVR